MKNFATSCLAEIFGEEMKAVGRILHSSGGDVTEKDFTDVDFDKIIEEVKAEAPTIWLTFRSVSYSPKQEKRNTKKDPDKVEIVYLFVRKSRLKNAVTDRIDDNFHACIHTFTPFKSNPKTIRRLPKILGTLSQSI